MSVIIIIIGMTSELHPNKTVVQTLLEGLLHAQPDLSCNNFLPRIIYLSIGTLPPYKGIAPSPVFY